MVFYELDGIDENTFNSRPFEVLLMFGAKWKLSIFICEITDVKDIEKRPLRDSSISAVDKLH